MARYGMVIDIDKCNGCYSCFLACRDEFAGNDYPPYSLAQPDRGKPWMRITEKERGKCPKVKVDYIPMPCLQCADAPCVERSENGEVYRRPDGIVVIDPEKALGKREIVSYCPYRAITWNEETNLPQKCTFCAHLIDKGAKQPRCVEACPSGALLFGDLDDPDSEISKLAGADGTEILNPEYGLTPSVLYRNLPGRFIAGEVVLEEREDICAQGVSVVLKGDSTEQTGETDFMGDFEFNGLESNRCFKVIISAQGYETKTIDVKTRTDVMLGEIFLKRT